MSIADKLTTIAENVPKVYEAGKTAEWSGFWDGFQQNGNRTSYNYAFFGWTDEMFYPKYDIILGRVSSPNVQSQGAFINAKIANLKNRLNECGVKLVFQANQLQSILQGLQTEEMPELDFTDSGLAFGIFSSTFLNCTTKNINLKNIEMRYISNPFGCCGNLEEITLEGCVIYSNNFGSLSLSASTKLTKQSLLNVLNALETISTSLTITLGATNLAKLTEEEKAIATDKGWTLV